MTEERGFRTRLQSVIREEKLRRKTGMIAAVLSVFVLFTVTLSMTQMADAANTNPTCGYLEHKHAASCYYRKLTCTDTNTNHVHNESCYEQVLVCGKHGHTHHAACFESVSSGHFVTLLELFSPTSHTSADQVVISAVEHSEIVQDPQPVPFMPPILQQPIPAETILEEIETPAPEVNSIHPAQESSALLEEIGTSPEGSSDVNTDASPNVDRTDNEIPVQIRPETQTDKPQATLQPEVVEDLPSIHPEDMPDLDPALKIYLRN